MESDRRDSAQEILRRLEKAGSRGPLLDVGCSFGWLLEEARSLGVEAYGIDPSESAVASARERGLAVRLGHFPEETWDRGLWASITFMDVLEHLPDVGAVVSATARMLPPGGCIAVQVPIANGPVFAISRLLERGSGGRWDGPLRRMLQLDFPYPHLHYFTIESLKALFHRHELSVVDVGFRPAAEPGTLCDRVAFQENVTWSDRISAFGLGAVLLAGRWTRHFDLAQVVARRASLS